MDLTSIALSDADHVGAILISYGPPERDDSTAYDVPRPPLPTRIIEYRPEGVKIVLSPSDAKMGDPPPYVAWKIVGCIDMLTNTKMSTEQATDRLRERL